MSVNSIVARIDDMAHTTWHQIKLRLKAKYGQSIYKSWLDGLELCEINGSEIILSAPSQFARSWVINNYLQTIFVFWKEAITTIQSVDIRATLHKPSPKKEVMPSFGKHMPVIAGGIDVTGQNVAVMMPASVANDEVVSLLDRRFTFEQFVVGKGNMLAYRAAEAIASSPDVRSENNPFFIYGGVGLGKTHLMHAIAWRYRSLFPGKKVVYLSAEKFMYDFIKSLRNKNVVSFKEHFRSVDMLMIDDIQFLCGKDSTQEEFYHTFNALIDQNKQLVISCDRSPSDLGAMEERVRSRLSGGLVVDMGTPDYEHRLAVLEMKAKNHTRCTIPGDVLSFLAKKVSSNIRELEGAFNKVVAHTTLMGSDINLEGACAILSDLLRSMDKTLTIEDIQKKVADYFSLRVVDLLSAKRSRAIARPRQVAMYFAKQFTQASFAEIGRKFGKKDHTTVMHALQRIEALLKTDKELRQHVEVLSRGW